MRRATYLAARPITEHHSHTPRLTMSDIHGNSDPSKWHSNAPETDYDHQQNDPFDFETGSSATYLAVKGLVKGKELAHYMREMDTIEDLTYLINNSWNRD